MGRLDEAAASYRRAFELQPDNAGALSNLGVVLGRQEKLDEAVACYRRALAIKPDFAEGHVNIASVLHKQEKWAEGAEVLAEALKLRPTMPEALFSMGVSHARREWIDEAERYLREALRWRPDHIDARMELANLALDRGRPADAVAVLREALFFRPDNGDLQTNIGILSLLIEDFAEGWLAYEWRMHCQGRKPPSYPRPLWDGGPLAGRTILLHFEQGLGDTIHFVRYAPLVKARGGRVVLGSPKALAGVLASCPGVDQVALEQEPLPPFDVHASLLTLPGLFGTDLSNLPTNVPYLSAGPERRRRWREWLPAGDEVRVGVVWRGNPSHPGDRKRSIPLAQFEPLARIPGVRLVSLQKDRGEAELGELGERLGIVNAASEIADFADTAALIAELDVLIVCDTSVAHLAGALAAPVWVALPFAPDWRWLMDREDSPWYPTMRLFRQTRPGDWDGVFARLAAELQRFVARRRGE
jgi:Flp pilus assembly protein TadD